MRCAGSALVDPCPHLVPRAPVAETSALNGGHGPADCEVQAKKSRRNTLERLPPHSFSTLLRALGTRCRHQCRLRGDTDVPPWSG